MVYRACVDPRTKKIRIWFGNNARRNKSSAKASYVRNWNLQSVVQELHRKEIDDLCKELQGDDNSKPYIGWYQNALKTVSDQLGSDTKSEYIKIAKTWNEEGTPMEIRRKYVSIMFPMNYYITDRVV
jgi:hypothetical protein